MSRPSRLAVSWAGWMCTELLTECPDCEAEICEPSGDLEKFLNLIEDHEADCEPAWRKPA